MSGRELDSRKTHRDRHRFPPKHHRGFHGLPGDKRSLGVIRAIPASTSVDFRLGKLASGRFSRVAWSWDS